jgi:hypothetical protein
MINDLYSLFIPWFIEVTMLGIIIQSERSLYYIISKVFIRRKLSQAIFVLSNLVLIGMTIYWIKLIK